MCAQLITICPENYIHPVATVSLVYPIHGPWFIQRTYIYLYVGCQSLLLVSCTVVQLKALIHLPHVIINCFHYRTYDWDWGTYLYVQIHLGAWYHKGNQLFDNLCLPKFHCREQFDTCVLCFTWYESTKCLWYQEFFR